MSDHADTIRVFINNRVLRYKDIPSKDGALAALDSLLAENQRLQDKMDAYADDVPALLRENQRLRDALERWRSVDRLLVTAEEALRIGHAKVARPDTAHGYVSSARQELGRMRAALAAVREENE